MKEGRELLQKYVRLARAHKFKVTGGKNGGGWQRLAKACGYEGPIFSKLESRLFLTRKFEALGTTKQKEKRIYSRSEADWKKAKAEHETANSDAFLASYEWRRVRMQVLKRDGARCACCGATTADGRVMNVDHIKPRKRFPDLALNLDNLQVLCDVCNHGKGNWDDTDWRAQYTESAIGAKLRLIK